MTQLSMDTDVILKFKMCMELYCSISNLFVLSSVLLILVMFFMPDSPSHLLSKSKEDQAQKSLQWLRGKHYDTSKELEVMKESLAREKAIGTISLKTMLTVDVYWKPFAIVMTLMFLQQFCGINAVIFYTQTIFIHAGTDLSASKSKAGHPHIQRKKRIFFHWHTFPMSQVALKKLLFFNLLYFSLLIFYSSRLIFYRDGRLGEDTFF